MDPLMHLVITQVALGPNRASVIAGLLPDLPFWSTYPVRVTATGQLGAAWHTGHWPDSPPSLLVAHRVAHSVIGAAVISALFHYCKGRRAVTL